MAILGPGWSRSRFVSDIRGGALDWQAHHRRRNAQHIAPRHWDATPYHGYTYLVHSSAAFMATPQPGVPSIKVGGGGAKCRRGGGEGGYLKL